MVTTSKYTWFTFLPYNLFEQVKKAAHFYFIVIMFMQMIDAISISGGQPAMLPPLIFVMTASMVKDAYEDYQRHKDDKKENSKVTLVAVKQDSGEVTFRPTFWSEVQIGDIVAVHENEFFPADLLLLRASNSEIEE